MKYIIRNIFFLYILIVSYYLLAQNNISKGYYITNEGKFIEAYFKTNDIVQFHTKPIVIDSNNNEIILSPDKIKYFKVNNDEYFSFLIETGYTVFLKRTLKDSVSILMYYFYNHDKNKNEFIDSSIYLLKTNTPLVKVKKETFRNDMAYYFSDIPEIKQKIVNKIYHYTDIYKIVKDYCELKREKKINKKFYDNIGYPIALYNHTLDFSVCISVASSKDFRHSFNSGLRAETGYNLPLKKNGLFIIKPRIAAEYFQKNYIPSNSKEKFIKLSSGFILKWNFYKPTFEEFNSYLTAGIDYAFFKNWLKSKENNIKINTFYGYHYQINFGIGATYKDVYFEVEYFIFKPTIIFYENFVKEMITSGYIFTQEKPSLNLNTLLITIGIHIKLKKDE